MLDHSLQRGRDRFTLHDPVLGTRTYCIMVRSFPEPFFYDSRKLTSDRPEGVHLLCYLEDRVMTYSG